jgi:RpiB/LacA/LacB family sugar-phosphate isomerase
MNIVIGSDHAGFQLKSSVVPFLKFLGHTVLDVGAFQENEGDDYPDFAELVGKAIIDGKAQRGILICGSGVGVSVAANKMIGIRAAVCHDSMNVLVLGSRIIGEKLAEDLVENYLKASFSNEERHLRRLAKVHAIEMRMLKS